MNIPVSHLLSWVERNELKSFEANHEHIEKWGSKIMKMTNLVIVLLIESKENVWTVESE